MKMLWLLPATLLLVSSGASPQKNPNAIPGSKEEAQGVDDPASDDDDDDVIIIEEDDDDDDSTGSTAQKPAK